MKKLLLMLFSLSLLLNAQSFSVNAAKDLSIIKKKIENRKSKSTTNKSAVQAFTRAGVNNELPDSIYTYNEYNDEKWLQSKVFYTYNDLGRVKQEIEYNNFDENGEALSINKTDYEYTIEGDFVTVVAIRSAFDDNEWVYTFKYIDKYLIDFYDLPLEHFSYVFENGEWVLEGKTTTEIEYDSHNRPIVAIVYYEMWEGELEEFSFRYDITYNEQGLYSEIIISNPPEIESRSTAEGWERSERIVFKYNEQKQLIDEIYSYYDGVDTWIEDFTLCYEYDSKGNVVKETTTYSHGHVYITTYVNIYLGENSNDVIVSAKSTVYPNPVSDMLFIKLEGANNALITLVNATGGVVAQQTITGSEASIPVQSLTKGYYFLTIKTDKGTVAHKIIKL